jgi:hypothetical protein
MELFFHFFLLPSLLCALFVRTRCRFRVVVVSESRRRSARTPGRQTGWPPALPLLTGPRRLCNYNHNT